MRTKSKPSSAGGAILLLVGFTIAAAAATVYAAGWGSLWFFAIGAPFSLLLVGMSLRVPTLDDRYGEPEASPEPRRAPMDEAHAAAR